MLLVNKEQQEAKVQLVIKVQLVNKVLQDHKELLVQ